MAKRKIIKIDEDKCNGCGLCIPNCPEGALQIIDGKVRLISDLFCDGLGACIGHCPQGAITIEEREAEPYDEKKVMANIVKQGPNTIKAHLRHLKDHGENKYLAQAVEYLKEHNVPVPEEEPVHHDHAHGGSCPGAKIAEIRKGEKKAAKKSGASGAVSQLGHWPVQLRLVPAFAPFLSDADILVAADCVPFAYADFHEDLLKGKVLLVGCPKFDDLALYKQKIEAILEHNDVKSITYARMEVPCCAGLGPIIEHAIAASGKKIPYKEVVISVEGGRIS